jgi:hypothetical protein
MGKMAEMNRASEEELDRTISEKRVSQFLTFGEHQKDLTSVSPCRFLSLLPRIWSYPASGLGILFFNMLIECVTQGIPGAHTEKCIAFQGKAGVFLPGLWLLKTKQTSSFLSVSLEGLRFQMGWVSFSCSWAIPKFLQLCKPLGCLSQASQLES